MRSCLVSTGCSKLNWLVLWLRHKYNVSGKHNDIIIYRQCISCITIIPLPLPPNTIFKDKKMCILHKNLFFILINLWPQHLSYITFVRYNYPVINTIHYKSWQNWKKKLLTFWLGTYTSHLYHWLTHVWFMDPFGRPAFCKCLKGVLKWTVHTKQYQYLSHHISSIWNKMHFQRFKQTQRKH